ncbi:MAG: sigma-70 family RNA polymerase sigma factor [Acidobacteriota bacterium]|nr:sigma-70 family RNA polymerase sigma factor [Acidobacteriota bacterium]
MASKAASLFIQDSPIYPGRDKSTAISAEDLRAIYTTHYRHVLQVCRGFFRQREDAEDAAAEVFLKLYRVLHQKDETLPFRPWVSQVAGHHCIDKLRQKKREKSSSLEEIDLSGLADRSTPSPLSQILRRDEQRQVREQLARLPAKYKVPLVLRYYKRMSYPEIAEVLNMRAPTVRVMLFRARNHLARKLRRAEKSNPLWKN